MMLEAFELELELPIFIDCELVEFGSKSPFVDEMEADLCRPS